MGIQVDMNQLFGTLYRKAMEGDADCGGLLAYNYFSESISPDLKKAVLSLSVHRRADLIWQTL